MRLVEYNKAEPIFIDANIFTYFALHTPTFQAACTAFLERVERGEIRGVTSTFVLNEVYYALLIGKGSELLDSTSIKRIKKLLTSDDSFAAKCYHACIEFGQYLNALQAKGLRIVEVEYELLAASLPLGSKYRLLPTDALHLATCQRQSITHIATADHHFDALDVLQVWKP